MPGSFLPSAVSEGPITGAELADLQIAGAKSDFILEYALIETRRDPWRAGLAARLKTDRTPERCS